MKTSPSIVPGDYVKLKEEVSDCPELTHNKSYIVETTVLDRVQIKGKLYFMSRFEVSDSMTIKVPFVPDLFYNAMVNLFKREPDHFSKTNKLYSIRYRNVEDGYTKRTILDNWLNIFDVAVSSSRCLYNKDTGILDIVIVLND